jgi:hypothetical protein
MKKFEFGDIVCDKMTGFKGIVTGYCEYITGCDRYLVQPKCKDDFEIKEAIWLDEGRLTKTEEISEINGETLQGEKKGACGVAPIK